MSTNSLIVIAFLSTVLVGCSTYTKEQCTSFNWRDKGYSAAMAGETNDQGLAHFNDTCGEDHKIAPKSEPFKLGYQSGLKDFCTQKSLHKFGRSGGEYKGTCPKEELPKILPGYIIGQNKFLKEIITGLQGDVSRLEGEVSDLENEVSHLRLESDSTSLTCEDN